MSSLGLRVLAVPPHGGSPVCNKPASQTKAQAPVRHGPIALRRNAVDPNVPKNPVVQPRQQLAVACAPIPGTDEFQQSAQPKSENGAKTAGARRARSFRVPMRCRTSLAFSVGQTTRRPNCRARPRWRCPARIQVLHPRTTFPRTLGYIPIHALVPFAGIIVWHRNHPPAVGTSVPDHCSRRVRKYTLTRRYTLIVARESSETRRRLMGCSTTRPSGPLRSPNADPRWDHWAISLVKVS